MDAATRYASEFVLSRPAVVVLHAPTGYLKTSTVRVAAQQARDALVVDCRDAVAPGDISKALSASAAWYAADGVSTFLAFDNAEAALARPAVLEAIHDVLRHRAPAQTIAICTRQPFPLPAAVLATSLELTIDDLAVDVFAELAGRELAPERVAEIAALTLGWPMPTYRLAAIAAAAPTGVPLLQCASRALDRLLLDIRLDFLERLPHARRERLMAAYRDDKDAVIAYTEPEMRRNMLASKLARVDGVLLRDGARHRIPGILLAALEIASNAAVPQPGGSRTIADPTIVFDVLTGDVLANGEIVRLPPREYEVLANLAIKNRHVPYDVLLEEIWGDANDDTARLKVTVGRLRKRLGFGTVQSVSAGFVGGPNVTCTLSELEAFPFGPAPLTEANLERLESIRNRYVRGKAGISRGWPWYTSWAAKIDAFIERALLALGRDALAREDYAVALQRARDAIAIDGVGQDAHEVALRALVGQGNVVGARRMLSQYTGTLRALDIAPPAALTAIVSDIAS